MRRSNVSHFNPRQYEKHLSPFGCQVLGTLIKQWNGASRDRDVSSNSLQHHHPPLRYNYPHRKILTFGEEYNRTNNSLRETVNFEPNLDDGNQPFVLPSTENIRPLMPPTTTAGSMFTTQSILPTSSMPAPPVLSTLADIHALPPQSSSRAFPVPTSTELITAAETSKLYHTAFSRDDLIMNKSHESTDSFHTMEDDLNNAYRKFDDGIENERAVLDLYKCRNAGNVNWDDMFDTELLPDMNLPVKETAETVNNECNDKIFHIQSPDNKSPTTCAGWSITDDHPEAKEEINKKKNKRKNQSKVTDVISKKVKKKKTEVKVKSKTRKEQITESFNNWLKDVDPNNPVEDLQEQVDELDSVKTKENTDLTVHKKPSKKIVQAQLANKGGIMKFGKPTKNTKKTSEEDAKSKTVTVTPEKNTKDQDKIKEKKSKSKFIAPIKSQIPVRDITYKIHGEADTDAIEGKLNEMNGQEIIVLLLFSNGFNQLNSQHTDDVCVPEAVMFYFNNCFFYMNEDGKHTSIVNVLLHMLQNNTIICYEGKTLLNYLTSKWKVEFDITCTFSIIDVKIGGNLLEPDSPPETFSALQRLTGSEPEFTIATTCVKEKAAWYATLLQTTASAIRSKLELENLWAVFVEIEMQILPIIADMEQRGVCVDMDKLKEMEKTLVTKMKQVENECTAAAGRSFQINSTVQVRALLYDELKLDEKAGLKVRGTLTTGAKSTSENMLKSLVSVHPLPRLILEYRHLHKAYATFLQGIAQYVRGGIVRPVWVQTAAATGRIASSNPNLQAIPKVPFNLRLFPESGENDEETLRFRCVYIARPEHVLLAADWRHVECRVFARAAADTSLQRALEAPDLFRRLATDWLQKPEEDVSSTDRERTKRIVYASLYGAGPRKLMDILDVDYAQALSIATSFDRTFPSLRSFGRRVAADCLAAEGRVVTLCGRTRTLPHIASTDAAQRSHAERQALNFIVQGSAADVCKLAMSDAVRALRERGLRARLLLQIHDELVWEVPHEHLAEAAEVIRGGMERCGVRAGLCVLPVALAAGRSWGELAPYPPTMYGEDYTP